MNRVHLLSQAHSQAPWRKQVQLIGLFLLILILVALVAGIYLSVTARASTIGRSIQFMHWSIEVFNRENADLKSLLANITSNEVMEKRAKAMGFSPVDKEKVMYVIVPGYEVKQPATIGNSPVTSAEIPAYLPKEYTQSLFDWLREHIFEPTAPLGLLKP